MRDDAANHLDTRANADTDRGGEDDATLTVRNLSRLRPEEEARRKEKGANYVSRYSPHWSRFSSQDYKERHPADLRVAK